MIIIVHLGSDSDPSSCARPSQSWLARHNHECMIASNYPSSSSSLPPFNPFTPSIPLSLAKPHKKDCKATGHWKVLTQYLTVVLVFCPSPTYHNHPMTWRNQSILKRPVSQDLAQWAHFANTRIFSHKNHLSQLRKLPSFHSSSHHVTSLTKKRPPSGRGGQIIYFEEKGSFGVFPPCWVVRTRPEPPRSSRLFPADYNSSLHKTTGWARTGASEKINFKRKLITQ